MGKKGDKKDAPAEEAGEEAFVRGGGSGLAPIEKRKLEQEAYAEAAADLDAEGRGGGKRRRRAGDAAAAGGGDDEDAFFASLSAQGRLPKFVELLKFKSLSKGCRLWGAVIEVGARELVVSLPHGLRGHVAYAEASDWLHEQAKAAERAAAAEAEAEAGGEAPAAGSKKKRKAGGAGELPPLASLFHIGQLVRCTVSSLRTGAPGEAPPAGKQPGGKQGGKGGGAPRKRVDCSLRVSKMSAGLGPECLKEGMQLPACVRSVEDHGYLLALGIQGVSGFLPKKDAAAAGRDYAPGALLEVVVGAGGLRPGGAGAGSVTVSCSPEAVAAAAAKEWEGLNIGSLLPGQLVTARVRNVLSDGLLVSFLTYFSGTVDPFHLGTDLAADWRKQFSPNQRLRARVLFVDPATKRVGLSLHRHLLAFSLPPNFPALGQVFEAAVVRRVDPGLGLMLELPAAAAGEGGEGAAAPGLPLTPGYAHISAVADKKVDDLTQFRPGQRHRARVLGFRPMDGLAVLTLKPSAVDQQVVSAADLRPGEAVSVAISRVEEYGLLVQLSSSVRALVPTLHASDLGSAKGLKKFKQGQKVAGRVLTVDPATRKVTVTLKPSLVGSKLPAITRMQDAAPGGRSHGVVTGAADFGVFVAFFGGVTGLAHVSECGLAAGQKPQEAYATGQVVKCRVLGADNARKGLKLSLTGKSAAKAAAAAAGGAAAADTPEAGAAPAAGGKARGGSGSAQDEAAAVAMGSYQPGDVVAGTVTAVHTRDVDGEAVPAWFEVAVAPSAAGTPTTGAAASTAAVVGRLEVAHLADHPSAAAALAAALAPGARLAPLLVLQRLEGARQLRLTRKASLLQAAAEGVLPASAGDVAEGALLAGYVASVTADAVFVRFLGGCTGRAGLAQLSDTFVSDPHLFFKEGQSVRATVVQVDRARDRFSVALKQSLCGGGARAPYLASLFSDLEAAPVSGDAPDVDWASAFRLGSIVPGEVHAAKEYGLLLDLAAHADVVGLAARHQVPEGASQEPGTSVRAVVLDVSRANGIVDLSLQPALLQRAEAASAAAAAAQQPPKKKAKGKKAPAAGGGEAPLREGQELRVTIELVKAEEGYCVVSLPAPAPAGDAAAPQLLAYLATSDFNLAGGQQQAGVQHQFAAGDSLAATVAALPSPATGGRLLLSVPLAAKPLKPPAARGAGAAAAKAGQAAAAAAAAPPAAGSLVEATVSVVHPLHAELALAGGCHGRLHVCEAAAAPAGGKKAGAEAASPLAALAVGAKLQVAVLGRVATAEGRRHGLLECSTRPEAVAAAKAGQPLPRSAAPAWGRLKPGQRLAGYVQEVERGFVWAAFSPAIRGRAFATQAATTIHECEQLKQRFKPGQPVQATVTHVDGQRHALDVSLLPADAAATAAQRPEQLPEAGTVVLGRVTAVGGGAVRVQLGARSGGRVALTDIHDAPVEQALAGLRPGQFCLAAVLGPDPAAPKSSKRRGGDGASGDQEGGGSQLLLSLRPSAGGQCAAHAAAAPAQEPDTPEVAEGPLQPGQLKQGQRVAGYVKSSGPAGVFVCLARNLDARIRLSQLADGFVEAPAQAFPEGRLVAGQVLKVEGDRVDLSLRSRQVGPSLEALEEGQVVRGTVKRCAQFGVFVELDGAPGVTGLAHVSEVADDFVKDLAQLFNPGQRVVARVLKVERDAGRLSLGLKPSYFEDASDLGSGSDGEGGPDFEAELAAGGSGSEGEDEDEAGSSGSEDEGAAPGSGSEEEGDDDDEGAALLEAAEEADSEEEFDLDEELAEAGSSDASDSDGGVSSGEDDG